jgi:hypothetical protein
MKSMWLFGTNLKAESVIMVLKGRRQIVLLACTAYYVNNEPAASAGRVDQ